MIDLRILDSTDRIAELTFELLLEAKTAALSFGSTYEGIFLKWNRLWTTSGKPALPDFFAADERLVDLSDPASNWGLACRTFLNRCGTGKDTARWASDEETYRGFLFEQFGEDSPVFDLIFLGLGPDGHTASLFPDGCPSPVEQSWYETVLRTTAPFSPPGRLTLGPEVIARAGKLVLTVTGRGKAAIFSRFYSELNSALSEDLLPPVRILKRREVLNLDTVILCDSEVDDDF